MNPPIRILVVDDDPDILNGTVRLLEKAGYTVDRAASGEQALLEVQKQPPNLLLLDHDMPGMDGIEVCRRIKQDTALADVLVVIVSGSYTESDEQAEGLESGVDGYIVRPIANRELLAQVRLFVRILRLTSSLRINAEELKKNNEAVRQTHLASINLLEDALTARDLAERASRALKASEESFRTLYESAPIGIEIYDISGSLIRANAAALAIFGLASEEPIKGFDIFADPNISADHKAMLLHGETIKYAAPFDFERVRTLALYPTTMRGIMELEVIIQPLAGGGYQVLVQDITARRRMEVTLLESEDKYRALIEKSHDIIYTLTAAGVFTFVSPAWTAILGHPINQVVGQSFQQFVHPDDIPGCMVWLQKMIETGQRQEGVEYRVRHTDGAWRWHTSSAVSLRDKAGKVVGLEGTARDITELRQAEVALEESKALVDAVVENIPLMIFLKEATDLRFVIFNRAGEELLGYDRKSLLGKNNMDLFPPEQAANFMVKDREVLDGNAGILDIPEEPILTARKGQRLLHTRKVCIRGADGVTKFLLGISEDITEQKKAEAALIKVKEDAVKANLAKSEFLAAMSHELRTPLNPVLGFAELLAVAPNLTDEQREWVAIIRRRGKDLLSLIGSVLDLSRIESEKLVLVRQSLALRTMMRDMIASIVPAADKRDLFLELEISPEVPEECLVDGFRLRQIILNLLTNAIKFTDTGGISVGLQDGRAARLCRPPAMDEAALLFSIQDTGIGIPENRQLAIFEPFTQVDSKHAVDYGGGAGLGLSIAQRLVELMGGKIWVESTEGRGSVFFFTVIVGVSQSPAALTDTDTAPIKGCTTGTRPSLKILVVDDDPTSRLVAENMLRKAGHTVRIAQDGQQALALLEKEAFDIVLMDIQMPVMDGLEATERIREIECGMPGKNAAKGRSSVSSIPIVAMTAFTAVGDRARFLAAGMDGYLSKPVEFAKLLAEIDRCLAEKKKSTLASHRDAKAVAV